MSDVISDYVPSTPEEAIFLSQYDPSKFPITVVTVDVVVFSFRKEAVLLIKRGGFPYKGFYALPGGFINPDETTRDAAYREALEEVKMDPANLGGAGLVFSMVADEPNRDPRGRAISHVFFGAVRDEGGFEAGDDAASLEWVTVDDILAYPDEIPLAFDHRDVLLKVLEQQAVI